MEGSLHSLKAVAFKLLAFEQFNFWVKVVLVKRFSTSEIIRSCGVEMCCNAGRAMN